MQVFATKMTKIKNFTDVNCKKFRTNPTCINKIIINNDSLIIINNTYKILVK